MTSRDQHWKELYESANEMGFRQAQEHIPTPMIVTERINPLNDKSAIKKDYIVNDGVCGFASIVIKPATSSFARWLRKNDIGYKRYYGGWNISISEHNQSMEKKTAHAKAMSEVFQANGIECFVESRMD